MASEGVPLVVIQRQLGHANLGITSIYLEGIDSSEIINAVHRRPAPVLPASAGLRQRTASQTRLRVTRLRPTARAWSVLSANMESGGPIETAP